MQQVLLDKQGNALVISTRCKRCNGDRFWVDFQGELQCWDCDCPAKVYHEKARAQHAKNILKRAQVDKFYDEEAEHDERKRWEAKRGILSPDGETTGASGEAP